MSGLINKVKGAAQGYKDDDTGKSGYSGVAADAQKGFKNYKADAADGNVDWKKQGTGVFNDLKSGLGHGGQPGGGAPPPPQ